VTLAGEDREVPPHADPEGPLMPPVTPPPLPEQPAEPDPAPEEPDPEE
jgi:hypothetical protein